MIPLRGASLRLAAAVPVMFLVIIAGAMALLGLAFPPERRAYAERACQTALLAACALMSGRALDLSSMRSEATRSRGNTRQPSRGVQLPVTDGPRSADHNQVETRSVSVRK